jgi:predicted alpha-1,6-mannanase (GH76 family)
LHAYDLTHSPRYLTAASVIFTDLTHAWSPCGGIWWDKPHSAVVAIANALFITVAARLAARAPHASDQAHYLSWARRVWRWYRHSGLIDGRGLVVDGINLETCRADPAAAVWSYNQGAIVSALVALEAADPGRADGAGGYLAVAEQVADAALTALTDAQGVLHERNEPETGEDGAQFKGVFARGLANLQAVAPQERYRAFLVANAQSVWERDRNARGQLGVVWSGPVFEPVIVQAHGSAMDVLVGAGRVA